MTGPGSVLITGGTGGLGSAVTAAFLADGWRVVVPWIAEAELSRLDDHPMIHPIQADLFDAGSATEVATFAAGEPDAPLRAVVNLVGGFGMGGRVHETPVEDFEKVLRLNLRPTYLMTQAVVPHLLAGGGGAIVCTSSGSALRPFSGAAGYITAKAGVIAFADALHAEYARDGVRVNTILPGTIDTPANRSAMPKADTSKWTPPARIATVVRTLVEVDGFAGAHLSV
jgi:NAD(P)-dependent dehydrogenase (short-subunit alcohol dehydrogenase family)